MAACIRFYLHEGRQHGGMLLRDWLFETARQSGIPGGTAFRACAGYGRHGLHEDHFFELAGDLPEAVEFFAESDRIAELIATVSRHGLRLLYLTYPVEVGMTAAAS
ncbi:MAG: DUF190 domain-containing protein [Betaproteobacteria bacterium]|nr:DUF190 domain-containing protein [Betaproteobacteria bacterium]